MRLPHAVVAVTICALAACAHGPGAYEDEAGNWQRAFRTDQPSGIEVVRSRVVRLGSGGTLGWFFLRATPARETELFANDLEPVPDAEAMVVRADARGGPAWFAPNAISGYAVWRTMAGKEFLPVILVFKDRDTGALYVHIHPR